MSGSGYDVTLKSGSTTHHDSVVLATGSSPSGYALAHSLDLKIVPPVPSLFTLTCDDAREGGRLEGLQGVTVEEATVTVLPDAGEGVEEEKGKEKKKGGKR